MKVIATDLDGTLFYPRDKKNMIYAPNLFLLQNFIDKGGKVVLISGRSVDYCKLVLEKLGRPATVIGFNGSCIYSDGMFVEKNVIPNKDAKVLIKETFDTFHNYGVFLMTDKGVTVDRKSVV